MCIQVYTYSVKNDKIFALGIEETYKTIMFICLIVNEKIGTVWNKPLVEQVLKEPAYLLISSIA